MCQETLSCSKLSLLQMSDRTAFSNHAHDYMTRLLHPADNFCLYPMSLHDYLLTALILLGATVVRQGHYDWEIRKCLMLP